MNTSFRFPCSLSQKYILSHYLLYDLQFYVYIWVFNSFSAHLTCDEKIRVQLSFSPFGELVVVIFITSSTKQFISSSCLWYHLYHTTSLQMCRGLFLFLPCVPLACYSKQSIFLFLYQCHLIFKSLYGLVIYVNVL